jgi:hypothetical protein
MRFVSGIERMVASPKNFPTFAIQRLDGVPVKV